MSSRGGLGTLTKKQSEPVNTKPVYTKIVKESLKSIILSGESDLDKFVSHRVLYLLGFFTGWDPRIFSLEFLPIIYFFIWSIVLFALGEISFALLFLITDIFVVIYFLILHTIISAWDKIKLWLIRRARKVGGIQKLTLQDLKYLLIYTRKVFGVQPFLAFQNDKDTRIDLEKLRKLFKRNHLWQNALNFTIVIGLLEITGFGVIGFINNIDIIDWFINWWFLLFIVIVPILLAIIGLIISRNRIRYMINTIPEDQFDAVLRILNEFEVFGGKI